MESYVLNLDYEYQLYNAKVPIWITRNLVPSVEPLYFYCNEVLPLATNHNYYSEFLKDLKQTTVKINDSSKNWWGEFSEISHESNCKLFNHRVNKALGLWTPPGGIIEDFSELLSMIDETRWRLKDPWMMGGTGQWRIDRELLRSDGYQKGIEERLKKGPLLLEKSLAIEEVLGTTFMLEEHSFKQLFTVKNILNSQGNFIGGEIIDMPQVIENDLNKVVRYWHGRGARGVFEIDSFVLSDGYYPCVEVNHRKTMGWFIWKLNQKLGSGRLSFEAQGGRRLNPKNSPIPIEWISI